MRLITTFFIEKFGKNLKKVYNMAEEKSQKGVNDIVMKRKIYQLPEGQSDQPPQYPSFRGQER